MGQVPAMAGAVAGEVQASSEVEEQEGTLNPQRVRRRLTQVREEVVEEVVQEEREALAGVDGR